MKKDAFKILAWSTLAAIIFVTVSPIGLRPADILPTNVDRALAFALMCGLFVLAYPKRWRWALLAALLAPGAIEMLQMFSPTRHARVDDAVVKMIGGLIGVVTSLAGHVLSAEFEIKRKTTAQPVRATRIAITPTMKALPVTSRIIQSVHFSQEDGRLRISMNDGRERLFEGVSESDALAFAASPSPGAHYVNDFKKRFKRAA